MSSARTLHGSAAARNGAGVLLRGSPGSGKSDLVLRLLPLGFSLVADDQVIVRDGIAEAPVSLAGLLEVRGLGLVRLPYGRARLALVVELGTAARLPEPSRCPDLDLPLICVDAAAASAPQRVALALDCLLGLVPLVAGAFA